jgi:hypothetical protein
VQHRGSLLHICWAVCCEQAISQRMPPVGHPPSIFNRTSYIFIETENDAYWKVSHKILLGNKKLRVEKERKYNAFCL